MMYGKPAPVPAPGMAPQEPMSLRLQDQMAPRTMSMNPASGLQMTRQPSAPMALMAQIRAMNPQQRQQAIASALMPQSQAQPIQNPMQGVAGMINTLAQKRQMEQQNSGFPQAPQTMGNLFGLANIFRRPSQGGGLY